MEMARELGENLFVWFWFLECFFWGGGSRGCTCSSLLHDLTVQHPVEKRTSFNLIQSKSLVFAGKAHIR